MTGDASGYDRRRVLRSIASVAVASAGGLGGSPPAAADTDPIAREWIIGCDPVDSSAAVLHERLEQDLAKAGRVTGGDETLGFCTVRLDGGATDRLRSALGRLRRRDDVAYVEPNDTCETADVADATGDDPRLGQQYAPQLVNAPAAWEVTTGSRSVTIGIVDTGVDYTHPDLAGRFDGQKGWDFVENDGDPSPSGPEEAHGTHVAGIAAGTTGNDIGVAGISDARLLAARVFGPSGNGSLSDVASGIRYCAEQGADIINLSLDGAVSRTVRRAIDFAAGKDVLLVASAGNGSSDTVAYPAAYDSVMAVSAIDGNENLAWFSNTGSRVELTAPGVDIVSSFPGSGYGSKSGTSMAAPVAAGVAALALSLDPSRSAAQIARDLRASARDVGLAGDQQGNGCVDARALVGRVRGGRPPAPSNVWIRSVDRTSVVLSWDGVPGVSTYNIFVDGNWSHNVIDQSSSRIRGLQPDTEYRIGVTAYRNGTDSRRVSRSVRTDP